MSSFTKTNTNAINLKCTSIDTSNLSIWNTDPNAFIVNTSSGGQCFSVNTNSNTTTVYGTLVANISGLGYEIVALPNLTSIQGQTIGSGVWPYVANMNQNVSSTSSPTFANITGTLATASQPNIATLAGLTSVGGYSPTWGYVANINQNLATTSSPTFATIYANTIYPVTTAGSTVGSLGAYYDGGYFQNIYGQIQTGAQFNITALQALNSIQGQNISASAWQYVNTMNQSVATTASPTFAGITATTLALSNGTSTALSITGNTTQSGNVTINGALNVNGAITYNSVIGIETTSAEIFLAQGNLTNSVDCGLFLEYATDGKTPIYSGLYRQATTGNWILYDQLSTQPNNPVNTSYTLANFKAGNITGTLQTASQPNVTALAGLTSIQGQSIGSGAWYYVNGLNQNLGTSSAPTFAAVYAGLHGDVVQASQSYITTLGSLASVQGQSISTSAWQYLNTMNQSVASGASPTFAGINLAGSFLPGTSNTYNLGSASYLWANVYATALTGTLATASQPNVTSLAGLTSIQGQSIATGAWAYVNSLNQSVASGASPTFVNVTAALTGNVTGNCSGTSASVTSASQSAITTLPNLTSIQGQSLSTSIWAYVNSLNQNLGTSSSPTFAGLTLAGSILPSATNTYNLGSSSYKFANIYAASLSGISSLSLSGALNVNIGAAGTAATFLSGNTSNFCDIQLGRTAGEMTLAVCAASGQFFTNTVANDIAIRNENSTNRIFIGSTYNSDGNPLMINYYGNLNVGTGGSDSAGSTYGVYCANNMICTGSLGNTNGSLYVNNTAKTNSNQLQFNNGTRVYTIQQIDNGGADYLRLGRNGYSDLVINSASNVYTTHNTLDGDTHGLMQCSGFFYNTYNSVSVPDTTYHGGCQSWNNSGVYGEVNYWNTYTSATYSFTWTQCTTGTPTQLATLSTSGLSLNYNSFFFSSAAYNNSGSGKSLIVTAGGQILSSSSSAKYKDNIADMKLDTSKIFGLRPREYDMKFDKSHEFGYIAEEVDALGLHALVHYNDKKEPESVKYDRLAILLLEELKKTNEEVKTMREELKKINGGA